MVLSTFLAPFLRIGTAKAPQRGILQRVQDWKDYRRLAQMEDYLLHDIDLTRDQVATAGLLWKAPNT